MKVPAGRRPWNKIPAAPSATHSTYAHRVLRPPIESITATKDGVTVKRVWPKGTAPSTTFNAPRVAALDRSPVANSEMKEPS